MSARTDIKAIVDGMPTQPAFYYMDVFEANADDNMSYPQVQMLEIESGAFYFHPMTSGNFDYPNIYLRFLDKTELDETGLQRDDVVEAMKQNARMFINRLNRSGDFIPVDNVKYVIVINAYDTNVSGVEINFQLKPIKPEGFCI